MPYQLHIQRRKGQIDESTWRAAVDATPGVRIIEVDRVRGREADTGIMASMVIGAATAEVNFGAMGWTPTFFWTAGRIRFNPPSDPDDERDPVRRTAAALAQRLRAQIVGEDGEIYDW